MPEQPHHPADPSLIQLRGVPLLEALEQRIPGARARADGVAAWALATAVELGLKRDEALAVRETARLSEVGSIYLPASAAALPPRHLASAARRQDEALVARAAHDLMLGAGVPERACLWVLSSRERYDGSGVPHGLAGGEIPLPSRIIATAAAYEDASAIARPALSAEAARIRTLAEVAVLARTVLDPEVIAALEHAVLRAGRTGADLSRAADPY